MGLFNTIRCNIDLPLPEDLHELSDVNWKSIEFQTKDMWNPMANYRIGIGKQLWRAEDEWEWIEDDTSPLRGALSNELRKEIHDTFTGDIHMHTSFQREACDYWVQFKLHIVKGVVKDIELVEFNRSDNTPRKESTIKLANEIQVQRARQKKLWYRVYKYLYMAPLRFIFRLIKRIADCISKNTWKVERKLLPF